MLFRKKFVYFNFEAEASLQCTRPSVFWAPTEWSIIYTCTEMVGLSQTLFPGLAYQTLHHAENQSAVPCHVCQFADDYAPNSLNKLIHVTTAVVVLSCLLKV